MRGLETVKETCERTRDRLISDYENNGYYSSKQKDEYDIKKLDLILALLAL